MNPVLVSELLEESQGLGDLAEYPDMDSRPTILDWLNWLTAAEQECVEEVQECRLEEVEITTEAGTPTYKLQGLADRKIHSVLRIPDGTSLDAGSGFTDEHEKLTHRGFRRQVREFDDFREFESQGIPAEHSWDPLREELVLYPTPDDAELIVARFTREHQKLATPGNVTWFLSAEECDGQERLPTSFNHTWIDRPRAIWIQGDGSAELCGQNITIEGTDYYGNEVSYTFALDGAQSENIRVSNQIFSTVTAITLPNVDDGSGNYRLVNVGISDLFDYVEGEDITFFCDGEPMDGLVRLPHSFRNTIFTFPRLLVFQATSFMEDLLGKTFAVTGRDKTGRAISETLTLFNGSYDPHADPRQDAALVMYGAQYFAQVDTITPEDASTIRFPAWVGPGHSYTAGDVIRNTGYEPDSFICTADHVSSSSFYMDLSINNYWTQMSGFDDWAPHFNLGISNFFDPEFWVYGSCTTRSMLPPAWARLLAPKKAVSIHYRRRKEFALADYWERAFYDALNRFKKGWRRSPDEVLVQHERRDVLGGTLMKPWEKWGL